MHICCQCHSCSTTHIHFETNNAIFISIQPLSKDPNLPQYVYVYISEAIWIKPKFWDETFFEKMKWNEFRQLYDGVSLKISQQQLAHAYICTKMKITYVPSIYYYYNCINECPARYSLNCLNSRFWTIRSNLSLNESKCTMTAFIVNQFYMLHNNSKQTMNDKQITTETEQQNRAYLRTAVAILILVCPDSQWIRLSGI